MNKKVVIVSSSPRKNGNSETLAKEFARGASDAGNQVEFITVRELKLEFCRGCLYCQSYDKCVISDSVKDLLGTVQNADVLVFATPVYYYSVSGQLKTFLDRLNPLFPRENKFKDVYIVATCADEEASAFDGAVKAVEGCEIEKDSSGRYINITFPGVDGEPATTYALTTTSVKDEDAYEDAMNQYEFDKQQYDQAIYEINAKIEIIQAQDKNLELRLKQLDTEQDAISTEIEAVQKVIEKNTESSFKTFG